MAVSKTNQVTLALPLPPTSNHIWKGTGRKVYLSAEYKAFKDKVYKCWVAAGQPFIEGRLRLAIQLHFPDKRRCDIGNREKALSDALKGHLFEDDSQIDILYIARGEIKKPGSCVVLVKRID